MTWVYTRQAKCAVLIAVGFLAVRVGVGAGMGEVSPATDAFPQLAEIRALAAQGAPAAQFKMGDYFYSLGDITNAVNWYQLAAEQGDRGAQISLAACYLQGRGVEKNVEEAGRWSARARGELSDLSPPPPLPRSLDLLPSPAPSVQPLEVAPNPSPASARLPSRDLEWIKPELEAVDLRLVSYMDGSPLFPQDP